MDALIDSLYECALVGDKWDNTFEALGRHFGSLGGMIFATTAEGTFFTGNAIVRETMHDFVERGWVRYNTRVDRLLQSRYQGFVTDLDIYTAEEISQNPMYSEFLYPRRMFAPAATAVTGIESDALIFTLEGFRTDKDARRAIVGLDILRPHVARAVMLSSRLKLERAKAVTRALEAIGLPAAIIDLKGALRAGNRLIEPFIGRDVLDFQSRIRLANTQADALLQSALEKLTHSLKHACSVPMPAADNKAARILHIIPVAGEARDLFPSTSVLLVISGTEKAALHDAVLGALFDLTPTEARIANRLAAGKSAANIATESGTSPHTVRQQIKSILAKTGTGSQSVLVGLLKDLMLS